MDILNFNKGDQSKSNQVFEYQQRQTEENKIKVEDNVVGNNQMFK